MDWNLVLTILGLVILVILIAMWVSKSRPAKKAARAKEESKDESTLACNVRSRIQGIENIRLAIRDGIQAAFERNFPTPDLLGEQFCSSVGPIVSKNNLRLEGVGEFRVTLAKLPVGRVGMETARAVERNSATCIPHYYLSLIAEEIPQMVSDVTGETHHGDDSVSVMGSLLEYARQYFKECSDSYSMDLFNAMHSVGFESMPLPMSPPLPFTTMHLSETMVRQIDNLLNCEVGSPCRDYGDWLFYRKGAELPGDSELEFATPEKFEEFNLVQGTRLEEARDYLRLLLNESLAHPDNINECGRLVNSRLSVHTSLLRSLDNKFNFSMGLDGTLGIRLDVDMSGNLIEVDVYIDRLAHCLGNIYTREDFLQVLNDHLRQFLDSVMRQQFEGWSVDTSEKAIDTDLELYSDRRGPHFQYAYGLTIVPPHRRKHDSDSQA